MRNIKSGRVTLKPVLLLLAVGMLFAVCTVSVLCLDSGEAELQKEMDEFECWVCGVRGVPFPDDDINRYVGQVVDPSVISEIDRLVEERYPGHYTTFTFKIIDNETEWIYLGDNTWEFRPHKMLLTSYLDHGIISPEGEVLEPPVAEQVKPQAGP